MANLVADVAAKQSIGEFVKGVISGDLAKTIAQGCKPIHPVSRVEVRKSEVWAMGAVPPPAEAPAAEAPSPAPPPPEEPAPAPPPAPAPEELTPEEFPPGEICRIRPGVGFGFATFNGGLTLRPCLLPAVIPEEGPCSSK